MREIKWQIENLNTVDNVIFLCKVNCLYIFYYLEVIYNCHSLFLFFYYFIKMKV